MAYTNCKDHGAADTVCLISDSQELLLVICAECFKEILQEKGLKPVAGRWQKP